MREFLPQRIKWNWFSKTKINKLEIGLEKRVCRTWTAWVSWGFFASDLHPCRIISRIRAALLKEFVPFSLCRRAAAPEFFYCLHYVWAWMCFRGWVPMYSISQEQTICVMFVILSTCFDPFNSNEKLRDSQLSVHHCG